MEDNQVIDVRVVKTEFDYVEQAKVTVFGVVVTFVAMSAMTGASAGIKHLVAKRRAKKAESLAKETEQDS